MKAAVSTSTAVFAISPSGQSAASYALAACHEPSGIPPARVIDRRRVAAGGLAADDPASRIVVRRRAAAVGRRAADNIAARVVEGALLRRGCVGHHRERQQCEQDDLGHGVCHDNTRIFLGQLIRECLPKMARHFPASVQCNAPSLPPRAMLQHPTLTK